MWNKTRAITITIIVHFLLLFGVLMLGNQDVSDALGSLWGKEEPQEEVVRP